MRAEVTSALGRYLLTVADDELILGYRDSEWTGIAPLVEEDVAFSSLAQDEIGHARLYYMLAADLLESDADHLALGRGPDDYYHASVLETRTTPKYDSSGAHRGGGDWARAVARRFLYDLFDDLRTDALVSSSYAPLAGAVQKIRREEQYHLRHGAAWWRALASAEGEARERLEGALLALWPGLLGLFEDAPGRIYWWPRACCHVAPRTCAMPGWSECRTTALPWESASRRSGRPPAGPSPCHPKRAGARGATGRRGPNSTTR